MAMLPFDIFEQIINRESPADIVHENLEYIAFRDINPKAQTHILVVPKAPGLITGWDVHEDNIEVFGGLFLFAKKVAEKENLDGYKLHMNVGEAGGQVVPRVHLHLLSSDYESEL